MSAFRRPSPVKLPDGLGQKLAQEASEQKMGGQVQKSTDPAFPYVNFEFAKNYLLYVPNVTALDGEGNTVPNFDRPFIHSINHGKSYAKVRCTKNVIIRDEAGELVLGEDGKPFFDGSCPICDNVGLGFDLAKLQVEDAARAQGLDPDDKERDEVKAIRRQYYGGRSIDTPDRKMTFPVVIFETDEEGKNILQGDDKKPLYTVAWYTVSDRQFEGTWGTALENAEELSDGLLTGKVFKFKLGKRDENGNLPKPRDAYKDLDVSLRESMTQRLRSAGILDDIDVVVNEAGWVPSKASEVLIENQWIPVSEIEKSIAPVVVDLETSIQMLKSGHSSGATNLDSLIGGKGKDESAPAGALPAGATDAEPVSANASSGGII